MSKLLLVFAINDLEQLENTAKQIREMCGNENPKMDGIVIEVRQHVDKKTLDVEIH